jgi:hypothetical protein
MVQKIAICSSATIMVAIMLSIAILAGVVISMQYTVNAYTYILVGGSFVAILCSVVGSIAIIVEARDMVWHHVVAGSGL